MGINKTVLVQDGRLLYYIVDRIEPCNEGKWETETWDGAREDDCWRRRGQDRRGISHLGNGLIIVQTVLFLFQGHALE